LTQQTLSQFHGCLHANVNLLPVWVVVRLCVRLQVLAALQAVAHQRQAAASIFEVWADVEHGCVSACRFWSRQQVLAALQEAPHQLQQQPAWR
jgi:hypothetical protein